MSNDNNTNLHRILKISVLFSTHGYKNYISHHMMTETSKMFVGEGRRIRKDDLLKVDSIINNRHNFVKFYVYCKDSDQEMALHMVNKQVFESVKKYKEEMDAMWESVQSTNQFSEFY
jgi:hypothetical protein